MENTLVHILGTQNHSFLSDVVQSYILNHELEHLKTYLDTAIDMNRTLNTIPDDNLMLILILVMKKASIMSLMIVMRACL